MGAIYYLTDESVIYTRYRFCVGFINNAQAVRFKSHWWFSQRSPEFWIGYWMGLIMMIKMERCNNECIHNGR